jgi:hypothetical protein
MIQNSKETDETYVISVCYDTKLYDQNPPGKQTDTKDGLEQATAILQNH